MRFSFDDLYQGDFHSETVIIHISLSSIIFESKWFLFQQMLKFFLIK